MAYQWRDEWENDREEYTTEQVEGVLNFCDIEIDSETDTDFIGFCPFHANHYDPAFAISKSTGLWTCFNPSCAESGALESLLARIKGLNKYQSLRKLMELKTQSSKSLTERLEEIKNAPPVFVPFPTEPVERMGKQLWESPRALDYLVKSRGLDEATLKHFGVGYSEKQDAVIFPMHTDDGMLVGFIGRGISDKRFKNSKRLPKKDTLWNLHRAKRHGSGTVIVCESCIDAMRIHQAGYPNVVALLGGGNISSSHIEQLNRNFDTIIIATDFEKRQFPKGVCKRCRHIKFAPWEPVKCVGHRPGRDLGRKIADAVAYKKIKWAAYDDLCVYPHDAKDIGEMTDDEIRQALRNSISNFEYTKWNLEESMP